MMASESVAYNTLNESHVINLCKVVSGTAGDGLEGSRFKDWFLLEYKFRLVNQRKNHIFLSVGRTLFKFPESHRPGVGLRF